MNREQIIAWAREAGLLPSQSNIAYQHPMFESYIERFAALVAAAERERFAAECIDLVAMYGGPVDLEAAIRARKDNT